MSGVLAMILAGGEGKRLMPLTMSRSKPSVPFGGSYRVIDFVLNNFVNSGFLKIYVLTQYKSQSLYMHLKNGWAINGITGAFIDAIPAQMRISREWYQGTADAIYQNLQFIDEQFPEHVAVFGSDHIYKMDIRQMVDFHKNLNADLTVSAIKMPANLCSRRFGVIEVDENNRMIGFEEKPLYPKELPNEPGFCLVSMGNYVFKKDCLKQALIEDTHNYESSHDFGHDIIPKLYKTANVFVYNINNNHIAGENNQAYWKDVGSLDAYWRAHMDLLGKDPLFYLNNPTWPLHTFYPPLPPANFTDTQDHKSEISHSMISAGCQIKGSTINKSVIGFRCTTQSGSCLDGCVLIGDDKIGKGAKIKNAILDRYVDIAPGFTLGYDIKKDSALINPHDLMGPTITEKGIIVIPQGMRLGY